MGRAYSVKGYINLVIRRSKKTVLVEGRTDKSLFERVLADKEYSDQILIDESSLVDDDLTIGAGAKERVRIVTSEARKNTVADEKLASIVDREWEDQIDEKNSLQIWKKPDQGKKDFVTLGHSIENYIFIKEFILDYIIYFAPQSSIVSFRKKLDFIFQDIIILSLALCEKARTNACLKKIKGAIDIDSIEIRDEKLFLSDYSDAEILKRTKIKSFHKDVNRIKEKIYNTFYGCDKSFYLIHGHIGEDIIWACVGKLLVDQGLAASLAKEICFGHKTERDRYWRDWLAKRDKKYRAPIDSVLDTLA